jgi:hypothetical protein
MKQEITALFQTRDDAVQSKNKQLFLSTQTKEIDESASDGYLANDKMTTTVLHVHAHDHQPQSWIAFVREDYFTKDELTHSGYLLYTIIGRNGGLIISDIRW